MQTIATSEAHRVTSIREALCRVGGYDQSIESTVSDAIVHSWLWSTASRSSPLGYFRRLLQVVDN